MLPLIRSRRLEQAFSILRSLCTSLSELGRRSCGESIFRTAISSLDLLSWPYTYPNHVPLIVIEADISSLRSVPSTIGTSPQSTKQEATQLKNTTRWISQIKAKTRMQWRTGNTSTGRTRALRRSLQTRQRIFKLWRTRSMPCKRHNTIAIVIATQASEISFIIGRG